MIMSFGNEVDVVSMAQGRGLVQSGRSSLHWHA